MARVDSLSKKSVTCDLSGSAVNCEAQDAAGDVAREGPCENEGLDMGKVDHRPPVEEGPNISSMNLSNSDDTPAGGGVMKEESMKMI